MRWYYVYKHIRLDTNTVFYVGKGHAKRAYSKLDRNRYWGRITKNFKWKAELIETDLSEEEAYSREIYWIDYYKQLGQCEANFQLGGGSSSQGNKHPCSDCGTKLKNIYAKRCHSCRVSYKKTDEYKKIHSDGQKKRFKDPEQRKFVASLRLGKSPSNKGVTGYKLSEDHKKKISEGLRRRKCQDQT